MELVTAEGRVVRASERENADLFWGLRGGGGNFGVVTGFEYRLYPVGPEVIAGAIAWRADSATRSTRHVPRRHGEGSSRARLRSGTAHGSSGAVACQGGPRQAHRRALRLPHGAVSGRRKTRRSNQSFGSPVGDIVQRRTYVSQQSLLDATQPKGRRYYWKSEYLPRLEPELLETIMRHAEAIRSPHSAIILFPLDGALNRLAEDHSAVGNRDTSWVLNITASWEKAEDDKANIEWARAAWRDMRRFSTGGTYINFLTEEEGDERIHAAYGNNYEQLVETKSKWDPANLFCVNKNIVPRA